MSNGNLLAEALATENAALQQRVVDLEQQLALRTRIEAQLAQAQQLARIGSYVLDFVTGKVEWSAETFRLLGMNPGDGPPSTEEYMTLLHPDDRAKVASALEEAITTGTQFDLEYRVIKPDGGITYIHSIGQPTCDAHGTVTGMLGTIADRSEQHRVEAEQARLLTQLRTFQLLVEHAVDAIVVANLSGQILYANRAITSYLGIPPRRLAHLRLPS